MEAQKDSAAQWLNCKKIATGYDKAPMTKRIFIFLGDLIFLIFIVIGLPFTFKEIKGEITIAKPSRIKAGN